MEIQQYEIKTYDNNPGFSTDELMGGNTSYFKHKKGIVALNFCKKASFWWGTKEVLADFMFNGTHYRTGFDKIKNKRSLGLRIDKFVKECIRLSNETKNK